jgi:hypothetical protein
VISELPKSAPRALALSDGTRERDWSRSRLAA